MKKLFTNPLSVICLSFIWGIFSLPTPAMAEKSLHATVSILPQKYFVEKIGGDRVHVSVMVLPGANPATYEPKPRQMVNLARAEIYFAIGVPFEANWLTKFSAANAKMKIVHTDSGITKIDMKGGGHRHHETDHGDKKISAGAKDPHIWLSPPLVMVQAKNILDGLIKADPQNRKSYERNYETFLSELRHLNRELKEVFQRKGKNAGFMVYHPSWGYFAKAYGLEQIPIEMEGKKPSPRMLLELIREARKEGIKVVFVQPQFSKKSAETVADAIGGKVLFADPLAEDWEHNLLRVAEKFKWAFEMNR